MVTEWHQVLPSRRWHRYQGSSVPGFSQNLRNLKISLHGDQGTLLQWPSEAAPGTCQHSLEREQHQHEDISRTEAASSAEAIRTVCFPQAPQHTQRVDEMLKLRSQLVKFLNNVSRKLANLSMRWKVSHHQSSKGHAAQSYNCNRSPERDVPCPVLQAVCVQNTTQLDMFLCSTPPPHPTPTPTAAPKQYENGVVRVQFCFPSTETIRTISDGEPRTSIASFTQLLSSVSCCSSSVSLYVHRDRKDYKVKGRGAQDGRVQELCESRGGCPGLPSLINLWFLWT